MRERHAVGAFAQQQLEAQLGVSVCLAERRVQDCLHVRLWRPLSAERLPLGDRADRHPKVIGEGAHAEPERLAKRPCFTAAPLSDRRHGGLLPGLYASTSSNRVRRKYTGSATPVHSDADGI